MREEGLLKKLVAAHGVSGFEKNVRKIIEEEAAPYADEMTVDAIGNLIVLKKGTDGENKKKLMFAAHMDEIGFMVKKIEADGRLKVCNMGWNWAGSAYNERVEFQNGVNGVVGCEGWIEDAKNDVGKLFTGEYFDGQWTFYQHHRVGAKVTRKILRRLHFAQEDIDLLCHLVNHHMRFHFMMTDRGIRRFKALDEYPRLIAMARADLQAREGSYTSFNHNMKYLDRAETPEQMLEPLLNGNEIMSETRLAPGPMVGVIRDALLQAQITGEVTDLESAVAFVREYARKSVG